MTAKKLVKPTTEDDLKIWGWYSNDDDLVDGLTKAEAHEGALKYKESYPNDEVVIFKMVSTVENKPYIKGI